MSPQNVSSKWFIKMSVLSALSVLSVVVVVVVYSASYINLFDMQIGLITVEGFTVFRKREQKQILSFYNFIVLSFSISCHSAIYATWMWWRTHYFVEEVHILIQTTNIIDVAQGEVFRMPVGHRHFSTAVTMIFFPMEFETLFRIQLQITLSH